MEIISYFEPKCINSAVYASASIEDMLRFQRPYRNLGKIFKQGADAIFSHLAAGSGRLYKILLSARRGIFITSSLLSLVLGAVWFSTYVRSFASPVVFSKDEASVGVLAGQMRNFVLASDVENFDGEGNISLISAAEAAALFTLPVSFSSYKVRSGDNISSISKKFGLTNISTLIAVNNISNVRLLRAGQELRIPSIDGLMYSIKTGDSLGSIAARYGVSIEEILDVNELSSDVLLAGQQLFVPGAKLDSYSLKKALGELFAAPLSGRWRISSPYGYRPDPFTGVRTFHTGVDLVVPHGTPIKAAMSGTIAASGYSNVYGNYVIINHGNEYQTLYAHLRDSALIKVGQRVEQGGLVGHVGNTGYSTGSHLHFSVYKNGKLINPSQILKF